MTEQTAITAWFNVNNIDHIRAYDHLERLGSWPKNFIPDHVTFPSLWAVIIANKLAAAYVEYRLDFEAAVDIL